MFFQFPIGAVQLLNQLVGQSRFFRVRLMFIGVIAGHLALPGLAHRLQVTAIGHFQIGIIPGNHRILRGFLRCGTAAVAAKRIGEVLVRRAIVLPLLPGDIISTGTPSGVGMGRKPWVWLEDGDDVIVASPQLGELHTKVSR